MTIRQRYRKLKWKRAIKRDTGYRYPVSQIGADAAYLFEKRRITELQSEIEYMRTAFAYLIHRIQDLEAEHDKHI